ncbi:hypothetical protein EV424DRAFT_1540232 [Suillus variegatus]|nr:hypothetical protein EV424DRAFT_1540232 [Suillus variegatus]
MTYVSNDHSWWPFISSHIFFGYWMVAAVVVVVYDWVLTLGQEIELIWRQHWSLMTVLYLIIRYIGIPYSVVHLLGMSHMRCVSFSDQRHTEFLPSASLTDTVSILQSSHSHPINTLVCVSTITFYTVNVINLVVAAMLGVIMIARLHAMYQGSRKMLIFLVIIFLAVNITCGVISAIGLKYVVEEEIILSGMYVCYYAGIEQLLFSIVWMLNTVWEVLALCLSVWIAVKHFRELRRLGLSTGSTIRDCFRVLIHSHICYFASFVGVSCFQLANFSPEIWYSTSIGAQILLGALQILFVMQMFVLGPRLILSVREYNAKLVAYSDAETSLNSIVFQERVHVSTSCTV